MSNSEQCLQSLDALRLTEKLQTAIRKRNFKLAEELVAETLAFQRRFELEAFGVNPKDAAQIVRELFPHLEERAA